MKIVDDGGSTNHVKRNKMPQPKDTRAHSKHEYIEQEQILNVLLKQLQDKDTCNEILKSGDDYQAITHEILKDERIQEELK